MNKEELQKMWDLHEKTRQGKNICGGCNKPKQMYYNPWCPRCEPPKPEKLEAINLIQILEYLEDAGHDGIKDRIWDYFCEDGLMSNGTYFSYQIEQEESLDVNPDIKTLDNYLKTVASGDTILFEVNW